MMRRLSIHMLVNAYALCFAFFVDITMAVTRSNVPEFYVVGAAVCAVLMYACVACGLEIERRCDAGKGGAE